MHLDVLRRSIHHGLPLGVLATHTVPTWRRQRGRTLHFDPKCRVYATQTSVEVCEEILLTATLGNACEECNGAAIVAMEQRMRGVLTSLRPLTEVATVIQRLEAQHQSLVAGETPRYGAASNARNIASDALRQKHFATNLTRDHRERCVTEECAACRGYASTPACVAIRAQGGEYARTYDGLEESAWELVGRAQRLSEASASRARSRKNEARLVRYVACEMVHYELTGDRMGWNQQLGMSLIPPELRGRAALFGDTSSNNRVRWMWNTLTEGCHLSGDAGVDTHLDDALALMLQRVRTMEFAASWDEVDAFTTDLHEAWSARILAVEERYRDGDALQRCVAALLHMNERLLTDAGMPVLAPALACYQPSWAGSGEHRRGGLVTIPRILAEYLSPTGAGWDNRVNLIALPGTLAPEDVLELGVQLAGDELTGRATDEGRDVAIRALLETARDALG